MDEEEMEETGELTSEEQEAFEAAGYGYPVQEEKQNIFSFFKRVITMDDTTRTSNLTPEELGGLRLPVRTLLKISLYCNQMGLKGLGNHFLRESQIISNSSLSKEGFLDKLAVTQKREMERTRTAATEKQKKTWFKKKKRGGYEKLN